MIEITIAKLADNIPFPKDLLSYVSGYRRNRIIRYKNEQDQKRSMLAELLLQKVAMTKMGLKNAVIRRNRYGKPYINNVENFHFNLSHSGHYVAIAVSERRIGIDIEKKETVDYRIAERFFCKKEAQTIFSCSSEQERADAFYRIWTLKESYVKAIGKGLSIPFSSFEFDIGDKIKVNDSKQRVIFHFYHTFIQDYSLAVCYVEQDFNSRFHFVCEKQLYDEMRVLLK